MYLILLLFVLVFICSFFYLKNTKEGLVPFETNMHDILPVAITGTKEDPIISVPNRIIGNRNQVPFNFGGDLITTGKLEVKGSLLEADQDMKVGKNVDVRQNMTVGQNVDVSQNVTVGQNVDVSLNMTVNGKIHTSDVFKNKHSALPPVGSIMAYAGTLEPDGWVICDGVARSEKDGRYNVLITLGIGTGTANATYTPPNLKGQFLKGVATATEKVLTYIPKTQVTLTSANMPSHTHTGNTGAMSRNKEHDHAMTVDDTIVGVQSDCNYTSAGSTNYTCGELNLIQHKGSLKDKRTGKADMSHIHPLEIGSTGQGTAFDIPDPSNYSVHYILKY